MAGRPSALRRLDRSQPADDRVDPRAARRPFLSARGRLKFVAVPFFAACMLGSAGWCAKLLRGYGPLGGAPLSIFAAVGTVLLVLPGHEFGQREHLLVAAALPYLCIFAL